MHVISVVKNYIFRDMMNTGILLMVIYIFFQKGNRKIGMEEYQFEYFLAEDNNTIYTRQSGGEYTIWLQRSEAPDGVVD